MFTVITGGSRGLGKAFVEQFLSLGFDVVTCGRNVETLKQLVADMQVQYPNQKVLIYPADLSKTIDTQQFADFVLNNCPQIEVLINNAGIFTMGTLQTEPDYLLEQIMQTNVYAPYYLTKKLLPHFIAKQGGHIFNISSVAGNTILNNCMAYTISKHALIGFSHSLRHELKQHQIKVTTVIPSAVLTDSWSGVDLPPNRLMPAEDIAQAIADAYKLSKRTVVEDIVLRPMLGDI